MPVSHSEAEAEKHRIGAPCDPYLSFWKDGTAFSLFERHPSVTGKQAVNKNSHLCCCSGAKSRPTLCDPVNCSAPDSFALHYLQNLLKFMFTESVVLSNHLIPCHPLLLLLSIFPNIRVFTNDSHQVAKVLELQLQSFQWIFMADFLLSWVVWSPCSPRDSQESSPAPQFKSINSSVLSLHYGPILTLHLSTGKTIALTIQTFVSKVMSLLYNE